MKHFILKVTELEKLKKFKILSQHVKGTNPLDFNLISLLSSWSLSCGGSMPLGRPGVAFPAGFPHQQSTGACASAPSYRNH